MGWVFHTIGIRELLGQSVKSREGKRTWLSTWKAGRTMRMGVGEGGGDRKPGQKEGRVPQTERGQTLKKGVDNQAQASLEGHLPCCTAFWEQAATCPEGKARRAQLWLSFNYF